MQNSPYINITNPIYEWILPFFSSAIFHRVAEARKSANAIRRITSDQGVDLFRTSDIQEEAIRYFSNLFQFSPVNHTRASISSLRSLIDFIRCSN
ncbi:unnamed protein product [Arabidopsis lyrata]|jgi:hypothetical protein|uniref:Uncharacterized protein n=2 Tax=Arabidopsis TaxID=3701 RepID=A0A8T1XAK4_ARASU|nr:hypothetical protein ISN44_Un239g000070 [Arabidopsis suecica]KAG7528945.1 hypothetical protein ISN45_Un107g000190 [Arabidopsis thaliana x Arabidopsis arenosa]KAG7529218.1 hypothetical protein ISN44_Un144g000150 [Arabidopsis suecica]KAG7640979.1 hypothetical protein ISN44_As02g010300 [Arabidopsis suecica]CAH8262265.1 unnamed protein product [Arabidopsis lyrata]